MNLQIGYGKTGQSLDIDENNIIDILRANQINTDLLGSDEVKRSLENPIGTPNLEKIVKKGDKVCIVTSDVTRPCPSYKILPPLLDKLDDLGVGKDNILIVFALGSHRKHSEEEKIGLVGEEIYKNYKCIDSDVDDYVHLGRTSAGTPVDIFSPVARADVRICLGNIEFHYFAGYSGGAKAIMPGVSTNHAIEANHSKMTRPSAVAGNVDNNEVRDDLEEAIENFIPIDFIINVVLDENKEIIYSVAGHYKEAHRQGCEFLDSIYKKDIKEEADIVIASQGGYPKDLNLYQTQKALDNAKHAIKPGGIIILLGACQEGLGNEVFESWMKDALSSKDLVERIEKEFVLGGHKAAAIGLVQEKAQIYMVSEMDKDLVESMFMEDFDNVQDAYNQALEVKGEDAKAIIMPNAGSTLPNLI